MIEIKGKNNIAKVFTDNADSETLNQIRNIANHQSFSGSKIRIMPDCHAGAGCVIGTTMTLTDKVIPNLVGVDIGCGVTVVKLEDYCPDVVQLDDIINSYIPSGFNNHKKTAAEYPKLGSVYALSHIKKADYNLALGSLGGGNHFIELNRDDAGNHYLIVHSGSRNLGLQVAKFYQDVAIANIKAIREIATNDLRIRHKARFRGEVIDHESIQSKIADAEAQYSMPNDLCYVSNKFMDDYLHDIKLIQEYAQLNRETMLDIILARLGYRFEDFDSFTSVHNYIDTTNMILRKGAIAAYEGQELIIPMNMRDGSIIGIGKGNEDWNFSAPHGAGRIMSRSEAKRKVQLEDFQKSMDGIYTTSVGVSTLDEAPMVYKPMDEIVANIKDTVEIVNIIKPLYNFKAGGE